MTFSIIVVCLNAGEGLRGTVESILRQSEQDYEIIIKDGGSTDELTQKYLEQYAGGTCAEPASGTFEKERIRLYVSKDKGIYDAMNQAVRYVRGDYVLFLNCGDSFYDDEVLTRVGEQIEKYTESRYIFYGNIYERKTKTMVQSNPAIDDFACYRNVPCHQACFYAAQLVREKAFGLRYLVRADYEHFLWCIYEGKAKTVYMPVTVALYEGGGFSETRENRRRSKREHREIVKKYMPAARVRRYRMIMLLTLAPLRTWIAGNPVTAGIYQTLKRKLYQ